MTKPETEGIYRLLVTPVNWHGNYNSDTKTSWRWERLLIVSLGNCRGQYDTNFSIFVLAWELSHHYKYIWRHTGHRPINWIHLTNNLASFGNGADHVKSIFQSLCKCIQPYVEIKHGTLLGPPCYLGKSTQELKFNNILYCVMCSKYKSQAIGSSSLCRFGNKQ